MTTKDPMFVEELEAVFWTSYWKHLSRATVAKFILGASLVTEFIRKNGQPDFRLEVGWAFFDDCISALANVAEGNRHEKLLDIMKGYLNRIGEQSNYSQDVLRAEEKMGFIPQCFETQKDANRIVLDFFLSFLKIMSRQEILLYMELSFLFVKFVHDKYDTHYRLKIGWEYLDNMVDEYAKTHPERKDRKRIQLLKRIASESLCDQVNVYKEVSLFRNKEKILKEFQKELEQRFLERSK